MDDKSDPEFKTYFSGSDKIPKRLTILSQITPRAYAMYLNLPGDKLDWEKTV